MIDEVSPDIVAIPVMTDSHYQIARRVIDKGVNIEVEKPFCMYLEEADILISMAKTQGTKIAVHHQSRSGGALDAICETIQKGEDLVEAHTVNARGNQRRIPLRDVWTTVWLSVRSENSPGETFWRGVRQKASLLS